MTDAPKRIWAGPSVSWQLQATLKTWENGDWDLNGETLTYAEFGTEYIRADLSQAAVEALEAKLARAVEGLIECAAEIDGYIWHEYPGDHPVYERYRKRDFDANPARATLAELTGGKDD